MIQVIFAQKVRRGKVKFWNDSKGYGYINPENDGEGVRFRQTEGAGWRRVAEKYDFALSRSESVSRSIITDDDVYYMLVDATSRQPVARIWALKDDLCDLLAQSPSLPELHPRYRRGVFKNWFPGADYGFIIQPDGTDLLARRRQSGNFLVHQGLWICVDTSAQRKRITLIPQEGQPVIYESGVDDSGSPLATAWNFEQSFEAFRDSLKPKKELTRAVA